MSITNVHALQDSESQNCKVSSRYAGKYNAQDEESDELAIDDAPLDNVESSDEDNASEGQSTDADRMEKLSFLTDVESSVDSGKETEYNNRLFSDYVLYRSFSHALVTRVAGRKRCSSRNV
jgi:hypothetical protein